MGETIKVGMADLKVAHAPDSLTTLGLGSCIGLTLYDPVAKVGGLVHFMLPDSTKLKNNTNIAKFGDTGIKELLRVVLAEGAFTAQTGCENCRWRMHVRNEWVVCHGTSGRTKMQKRRRRC